MFYIFCMFTQWVNTTQIQFSAHKQPTSKFSTAVSAAQFQYFQSKTLKLIYHAFKSFIFTCKAFTYG